MKFESYAASGTCIFPASRGMESRGVFCCIGVLGEIPLAEPAAPQAEAAPPNIETEDLMGGTGDSRPFRLPDFVHDALGMAARAPAEAEAAELTALSTPGIPYSCSSSRRSSDQRRCISLRAATTRSAHKEAQYDAIF